MARAFALLLILKVLPGADAETGSISTIPTFWDAYTVGALGLVVLLLWCLAVLIILCIRRRRAARLFLVNRNQRHEEDIVGSYPWLHLSLGLDVCKTARSIHQTYPTTPSPVSDRLRCVALIRAGSLLQLHLQHQRQLPSLSPFPRHLRNSPRQSGRQVWMTSTLLQLRSTHPRSAHFTAHPQCCRQRRPLLSTRCPIRSRKNRLHSR